MIREIASKAVDSDDEGDEGEAEVIFLARRSANLLEGADGTVAITKTQ